VEVVDGGGGGGESLCRLRGGSRSGASELAILGGVSTSNSLLKQLITESMLSQSKWCECQY
jgi:hypothetical protein